MKDQEKETPDNNTNQSGKGGFNSSHVPASTEKETKIKEGLFKKFTEPLVNLSDVFEYFKPFLSPPPEEQKVKGGFEEVLNKEYFATGNGNIKSFILHLIEEYRKHTPKQKEAKTIEVKLGEVFLCDGKMYGITLPSSALNEVNDHGHIVSTLHHLNEAPEKEGGKI